MNETTRSKRYEVRDGIAGQDIHLIPASDYRRVNRWQIVDTATNQVYDEFNSKRAATLTARDLNDD